MTPSCVSIWFWRDQFTFYSGEICISSRQNETLRFQTSCFSPSRANTIVMHRPRQLIFIFSCQRDKFLGVTVNTSDNCSVSRSLLFTTCASLKDNLSSLGEEGLECDLQPFAAHSRRKGKTSPAAFRAPPRGFQWSAGTLSVEQRRGPRWVSGSLKHKKAGEC